MRRVSFSFPPLVVVLCSSLIVSPGLLAQEESVPSAMQGCTFTANPDEFLSGQARAQNEVFARSSKLRTPRFSSAQSLVSASNIPRRNFIDDEVFGKLSKAGVPSAALSTDEEFVRRIYLDLTGRIPGSDDVRAFVADSSDGKRDAVID